MTASTLLCTKCKAPLPEALINRPELTPCPSCAAPLQVEVFPALFRPVVTGRDGEAVLVEGESTCFYHPQKKAVLPCDGCGRFLCALCDCELHGQHFCPACLEVGRKKGKIKSLENSRTRYDNMTLALAIYPLLIFYFTILTAPLTLLMAILHWRSPLGLTQRSRIRFIIAIVIAGLQIGGWTLLFIGLASR